MVCKLVNKLCNLMLWTAAVCTQSNKDKATHGTASNIPSHAYTIQFVAGLYHMYIASYLASYMWKKLMDIRLNYKITGYYVA